MSRARCKDERIYKKKLRLEFNNINRIQPVDLEYKQLVSYHIDNISITRSLDENYFIMRFYSPMKKTTHAHARARERTHAHTHTQRLTGGIITFGRFHTKTIFHYKIWIGQSSRSANTLSSLALLPKTKQPCSTPQNYSLIKTNCNNCLKIRQETRQSVIGTLQNTEISPILLPGSKSSGSVWYCRFLPIL